jgi:hypothetical protein
LLLWSVLLFVLLYLLLLYPKSLQLVQMQL